MTDQAAASITQIASVAVPTADQDRALGFYTGVLGLRKTRDVPFGNGQRWIEVAPSEGTTTIALPPLGDARVGVDTGIRLTTRDADSDHESLMARGVDVDPEVLRFPGVPPMFSLRDPDGNTLYVVQQM
jgi:catechol 2,3-dioxygenase-like lactoylglutathione lyase family enzyme